MICFDGLESRTLLSAAVPQFSHIVVLLEENHAADEIYGNPDAPFFNMLATQGAEFTQSYALGHPSEPNYLALFSGSTHGVTDDGTYSFTGQNIATELQAAGLSFTGYAQAPSVIEHDPWESFTNSSSDGAPFSQFPTDFSQLPALSYVVPNLNNDMHNGTIAAADKWAQTNLGAYAQWAKSNNSLLILETDEDDGTENNNIPTIIYGADVVPGMYSETINDYSLLRTMEDAFQLPALGNAKNASPITDIFQTSLSTPPTEIAPTLTDFEVNATASNPSTVDSLTLEFSEPVTIADDTITLTQISPKTRATTSVTFNLNSTDAGQSFVMTFPAAQAADSQAANASLPGGVYVLSVSPSGITDSQGQQLSGGTQVYSFSQLHGKVTGNGTGKTQRFGKGAAKDGFKNFVLNDESQLADASN
jgi:phosphatidylinositol-3-phosphatase